MEGDGYGYNTWRSGAYTGVENAPVDTYSAPHFDSQPPPTMDFYQQNIPENDMQGADMEMRTDGREMMGEHDDFYAQEGEHQQESLKRPWEKPGSGPDGFKFKRKKVPVASTLSRVQPKNAVMCLNELRPGLTYTTEQSAAPGQLCCISVEIDGEKYRGFGSSKQLAKQAAAEAALISFVKPSISNIENQEDDNVPWAALASFAIYKLFNDWREGRVGLCPQPPEQKAFLNQPICPAATTNKDDTPQATTLTEAICAHLGSHGPNTLGPDIKPSEAVKLPNPAKQVPESAASQHPVMVLNQMRPGVQYNTTKTTRDEKTIFTLSATIDGKEFTGEGSNVKKAKFFLAKAAILELFGVESTFEL